MKLNTPTSLAVAGRQNRFDAAAIGLSAACIVHCLAMPLLAAVLPLFAAFEGEWIHWLFLVAAIPVSWLALRRPGTPGALRAAATLGLAGLLAGALGWPGQELETAVTVAAGLTLSATHLANALRIHSGRNKTPCPIETGDRS